jgi:hypothetical protein
MIIIQNGVAIIDGVLGINADKTWGKDWESKVWNINNCQVVDIPSPADFKSSCFIYDANTTSLTATAEYAAVLAASKTKESNEAINAAIIEQLDIIDGKSIRALRTNDAARLATLESQAAALRAQLIK